MEARRYTPNHVARWDEFVACSCNGTFLHRRGYMDYHSDRFHDHSLMVVDDRGHIEALLPANTVGTTFYSHQGLTYGGLILPRRHQAPPRVMEIWASIIDYLSTAGFKELIYKPVPHIYHRYPCDADLYALSRSGAYMSACGLSMAVSLDMPDVAGETARQLSRRTDGLTFRCSTDYEQFMTMLENRLAERYGVRPVHSLAEVRLLAERFPENIILYMAHDANDDAPLAGVLLYLTPMAAHTQYIATTSAGRERGVLPALISHIASQLPSGCRYLDFGTSADDESSDGFNDGLIAQKYSLGGRPVLAPTFTLEL
ncbi:MAG: GNAT family N-acetyltransferase [Bacteroides sp.]|nr:GNAT family N-acetyltransferase [Bacteroides sp.]MCM1413594.1 GNAT family N-acetyltransferase [Bacteroides sp.]MCM1471189.1 GNAT family N-acetyltransferase [Bacteroides sp.]